MRKVIQISAVPAVDSPDISVEETVYALCDDGAMFYMLMGRNDLKWLDLPPVPQDESDDAKFLAAEAKAVYDEACIDQSRAGWETVEETIAHALQKAYSRGRRYRHPMSGPVFT